MKKLISILVATALLLSLSVAVFATETEKPTVTVGTVYGAEVDAEVTVDVVMSAAEFTAFGLQVTFDAEALELKKIEKGEAVEDFMGFTGSKKTGKVTGFHTEDLEVEGVLFSVTFVVLAEGEHKVELVIDSFNKADQSLVEVEAVAGLISTEAEPTEPSEPTEPEETEPTEPTEPEETEPTEPSEPEETDPTEPSEPGEHVCNPTREALKVDANGSVWWKYTCECGDTYVMHDTYLCTSEVTAEPTCVAGGTTIYYCSHCDQMCIVEEPAALGHDYVVVPAVAPTCTETGLTEGEKCSRCGDVKVAQEEVPALGHTEVVDEAVAPTCTETGLTEGKHCSVCEEVLVAQEVVEALGHTVVVDEAVAPTCTETGLTEGSHCSVCEEVLVAQEVVEALGHNYEDGVCTNCGETDPNPSTSGMNILAVALIAVMSISAVAVTASKKEEE